VSDVNLDSIPGCIAELTDCNREVAIFAHQWATDAGELKLREKRYERLYKAAMRGTQGRNADERSATAQAAVEQVEPGLAEVIEELTGKVEEHKTLFKTIERRAGNAQSILSAHKEAQKTESYVAAREFVNRPVAA
jgi:hypothetical protein